MESLDEWEAFKKIADHMADIRPFNRQLGITRESMDNENGTVTIAMKPELVGNTHTGTLHGGVISALMDITGGFVVFLDIARKLKDQPPEKLMERVTRIASVDMRVDYLRPGIGDQFIAKGFVIRTGSKVAVARTELRNEKDVVIAVGTGTYTVG